MAKRQVRHLMGRHARRSVPPGSVGLRLLVPASAGESEERRIALFFENDQLARIEGDLRPEGGAAAPPPRQTLVPVPDHEGPSFVDKALGTIGLGDK